MQGFRIAFIFSLLLGISQLHALSYNGIQDKNPVKRASVIKSTVENDSSTRVHFLYSNILQFVGVSQPNLGYEWRIHPLTSMCVGAGYKFFNYLSVVLPPSVAFSYQGPRIDLSLKRYSRFSKFFWGPYMRSSYLTISNATIRSGHGSVTDHITNLNGKRIDVDFGVMLGLAKFKKKSALQLYGIVGIRNVWAQTSAQEIVGVANGNITGAIPGCEGAFILNGYLSFVLFQIGLNISIPCPARLFKQRGNDSEYPER